MKKFVKKTGWVPKQMIALSASDPWLAIPTVEVTFEVEEDVEELDLAGAFRAISHGKVVELVRKAGPCDLKLGAKFSLTDLACLGMVDNDCIFIVVEE